LCLDVSWCETWFLSIVNSKFGKLVNLSIVNSKFGKLGVWECALMSLVLKFDNEGWTCQLVDQSFTMQSSQG